MNDAGAVGTPATATEARIVQLIDGGDHPPFSESWGDYLNPLTGLPFPGLSVGMDCAATEGIPSGAIIQFDVTGPRGPATWLGRLDERAHVRVAGGIDAPGNYVVTTGSWFLAETPANRHDIGFGSLNRTVTVPNPPAENPCDTATLAGGTPLVDQASSGTPARPETRLRTVTTRKNAFPWSVPTGAGVASATGGALWLRNRRLAGLLGRRARRRGSRRRGRRWTRRLHWARLRSRRLRRRTSRRSE